MAEDRLSIDKHCEMLTNLCRDRHVQVMEGIKFYAGLFVAIVGGSTALAVHKGDQLLPWLEWVADGLMVLGLVASGAIVVENHRAWRAYRHRLSELAGPAVIPPPPHFAWIYVAWVVGLMTLSAAIFLYFNPLGIRLTPHA